jgi:hypothetical protein
MKMIWVLLICLSLTVVACGNLPGTFVPPTGVATQVPTNPPVLATPTAVPAANTLAEKAAIMNLAKGLGIPEQQVSVVSAEAVTWPNGCIGVQRLGVMCTMNQVPGFRIVLSAKGSQYEVHTNQDGSVVAPEQPLQAPGPAEIAAIHQLANNLGIADGDVKLMSAAIVEWPDSCLGVAQQGVMCAQIVTPGFLFTLEAGGRQYEYHTNQDGSMIMPGSLALNWKEQGGLAGLCEQLTAYLSGELYAVDCHTGDGRVGVLKAAERTQLYSWMDKYSNDSINLSDPQGAADAMSRTAELFGTGQQPPRKGDELAIFNFGQALYRTLYTK